MSTVTFPPRPERAVSPHELGRYAAGELQAPRRAEIAALLQHDEGLADELRALEASRRAFNIEHPFSRLEAKLDAESASVRPGLWTRLMARPLLFGPAFTAAAALLFIVVSPGGPGATSDTAPGTREKGGQHMGIMLNDSGDARALSEGAVLQSGDRIQFVLRDPADATMRVIVGIDGRREVTLYDARPLTQKASARVAPFDDSLILDDAIGVERFFVVYATERGEPKMFAEQVMAAARDAASSGSDLRSAERLDVSGLPLAPVQSSFFIVKQTER